METGRKGYGHYQYNANLNDHNNLGYGDRPVTEAVPELMTKPDETLVTGTFPAVIDHPEPTKNVWCETDKQDIPVRREEMTSVCLLPKTVLPGTHQLVEMEDNKWKRVDHRSPIVITAQLHTLAGIAGV